MCHFSWTLAPSAPLGGDQRNRVRMEPHELAGSKARNTRQDPLGPQQGLEKSTLSKQGSTPVTETTLPSNIGSLLRAQGQLNNTELLPGMAVR